MEYIRVSVAYTDIFHEPKAREMTRNISCVMSMISDLSYTLCMLRILSRALHNNSEILRNISCYAYECTKDIKYRIKSVIPPLRMLKIQIITYGINIHIDVYEGYLDAIVLVSAQ